METTSSSLRRRLLSSPANNNESVKLELPRAWEPLASSRSSPVGGEKETRLGLFNGD
jgi:hypothetical protein